MATVTNTSLIASELRPGIKGMVTTNAQYPLEYKQIFKTEMSDKQAEFFVEMKQLGLATVKPEGTPTEFDNMQQLFLTTIYNLTISIGVVITLEALQDNLYKEQWPQGSKSIIDSVNQLEEVLGSNVLTNGFNANLQVLADGQPLFSTAHPTAVGNTYSNTFAISTALNETAIEDMVIGVQQLIDAAGLRTQIIPEKLVVPPQLQFQASRTLDSRFRPATANNDINSTNHMGILPKGFTINHYLTNPNLYAILTNKEGLVHLERVPLDIDVNSDPDTNNIKIRGYKRLSFGCWNARSIFGAQGS